MWRVATTAGGVPAGFSEAPPKTQCLEEGPWHVILPESDASPRLHIPSFDLFRCLPVSFGSLRYGLCIRSHGLHGLGPLDAVDDDAREDRGEGEGDGEAGPESEELPLESGEGQGQPDGQTDDPVCEQVDLRTEGLEGRTRGNQGNPKTESGYDLLTGTRRVSKPIQPSTHRVTSPSEDAHGGDSHAICELEKTDEGHLQSKAG